ncbi:MAG: hypothetical protein LBJ87_09355, partial [bacterium]|nr:hypothetical protein [bacterium]
VGADSHSCSTDISEVQPPRGWSRVPGVGRHDLGDIPYLPIIVGVSRSSPVRRPATPRSSTGAPSPSAADLAAGAVSGSPLPTAAAASRVAAVDQVLAQPLEQAKATKASGEAGNRRGRGL